MYKKNDRGRKFFANTMHKEMFLLIFSGAALPTALTMITLFYIIFRITAAEFGLSTPDIDTLIPAAKYLLVFLFVSIPVFVLAILFLTYRLTHKTLGPFDRIIKELDECIEGAKKGPIIIRKGDKFMPLVERINILLKAFNKE